MTDKRIKEDCPFCGNSAKNIQVQTLQNGVSRIICPNCMATFDYWGSKQECISKWNLRKRG